MQGKSELQVIFAVLDGCYTETSFGGILEMRTHVRDVGDGRHDGQFNRMNVFDSIECVFGIWYPAGLLNLIVNNPC